MRTHSLAFRLSAATAVAGLVLAQLLSAPAFAQSAPPGAVAAGPEQQAADPPERAGRVAQITGTVSFHTADADQWSPATTNYPVATGDAFWTEPNASTRLEISASRLALAGGTELDVNTLDPNGLQATLPQGELYLRLRDLAPNEAWSVQTPRGLVTFAGAGRYGLLAGDTQNPTMITVLDGSAQISGPGLSLQLSAGQTATISGGDTFQDSVGPAQMDSFLTAMQQAEQPPPAPAVAPPAIVAQMPGGDDLAAYGSWSQTQDYGDVWYPQVASGWVPYREGHWAYVAPWGWTWVDDAPWGFAPFHYGRWVQVGGRWGWTPATVTVAGPPVYAPALVAFVGIGVGVGIGAALASGSVGWFPLGPREAYHPWYHTSETYLRAVNRTNVTNITVINNRNVTINNFANRGAATVVPASAMAASRPVRQVVEQVDPRQLATARPVIGTPPIRPTAATAGITPGLARQMHLAPATPGTAVVARPAPGPAIHAMPHVQGVAARPPLLNPAERGGGATAPGGVRPAAETPERTGIVARPGVAPANGAQAARPGEATAPGALPGLRTPAEREAGPPPIEHAAPGHESEMRAPNQPGVARPAPPPGGERPAVAAPNAPHPAVEPPVAHPAAEAPRSPERPASPAAAPHAAALPEVHAPAQAERPAPRPEEHAAPAVAPHPMPPPQEHAAPRPEVHVPAPAPHPAPAPAPRPEVHAAPPPHPAPAPHPEVHAAPAPHPAPAAHEEKKPGEH